MSWHRPAFLLFLFLVVSSCFEAPVREELRLRFLPNGAVVATSTVRVADPRDGNPALARRLAETRRELTEGTDPWGARFGAAAASAERFSWEKRLGALSSASRSALIAEPEGLEAFFRDTSLAVTYTIDAQRGTAELLIVPGASTRATQRQREEMKKTLDAWTADVAEYLQTGQELYAYLDDRPDRARSCFGALFAERLNEKDAATLSPLTSEEKRKLDRLDGAMERILAVLAVPEGAAYSPDEISHLIYDPFPARLTLKLPGAPLAVEGFLPGADGTLTVASLGLWDALRGSSPHRSTGRPGKSGRRMRRPSTGRRGRRRELVKTKDVKDDKDIKDEEPRPRHYPVRPCPPFSSVLFGATSHQCCSQ